MGCANPVTRVVVWDWCGTLFCEGDPVEYAENVLEAWVNARHAILTNARTESVLHEVNRLGWMYFERVHGGERFQKPDPRAMHELLRSLGVMPTDAIMIGDQEVDVQCARRAGCGYLLLDANTTLRSLSCMTLDELFAKYQSRRESVIG